MGFSTSSDSENANPNDSTSKTSESREEKYKCVPIHRNKELIPECVKLINSEWPRSIGARLWSLEASKDELPTCLVLTNNCNSDDDSNNDKCNSNSCDSEKKLSVLAHLKLTPIPSIPTACFIESVVVWESLRGRGIGSYLMRQAEDYCKFALKLSAIYLSTTDKEDFYVRLGYEPCNPVSIYGGPVLNTNTHASFRPNATKKKYFRKILIQEEDDEISR